MEHPIDPMFPLELLPYNAHCRIVKIYYESMKPFKPLSLEEDLSTGKLNRLVYRYPEYFPRIVRWIAAGKQWRDYFHQYHPVNALLFEDIFSEIAKKLDNMSNRKENILGEIEIKNSKIK